ncbi:MAG: pantoate--beta-alanine ligase [Verrucomicrobia bacterium]|nr:pantoate--beta-alanine ligase [Verrucomicrobiota bacterium]
MNILKSPASMQRLAMSWRRQGISIGFVPTMGYLHEGHLNLMRRARRVVGEDGIVIVSIYVNPTQFSPSEDFSSYPRDPKRDLRLCGEEGVDVVFTPEDRHIYFRDTAAAYSTYVVEESLSGVMEGESRPTHFRGVTTIVAKLFNLVLPTHAVFGEKDFQQAAVIKRMVRDLHFPVKIVTAPTSRESDGLAISSRNKYLNQEQRADAVVLWRCIETARKLVRDNSSGIEAGRLRDGLMRIFSDYASARPDYIEFFDEALLTPVSRVRKGHRMALAVYVGETRLIDNARL